MQKLQQYVLQCFEPVIDKQTWNKGGSTSKNMLHSDLELVCDLQYLPCIGKASKFFSKYMENGAKINKLFIFFLHLLMFLLLYPDIPFLKHRVWRKNNFLQEIWKIVHYWK